MGCVQWRVASQVSVDSLKVVVVVGGGGLEMSRRTVYVAAILCAVSVGKYAHRQREGVALHTAQGADGHVPCADNAASYRVSRRGLKKVGAQEKSRGARLRQGVGQSGVVCVQTATAWLTYRVTCRVTQWSRDPPSFTGRSKCLLLHPG
jgi:hypothetical protein